MAAGKGIPPFLILYGGTQFGSATLAPFLAGLLNAAGSPSQAVRFDKSHQEFGLDLLDPADPKTQCVGLSK